MNTLIIESEPTAVSINVTDDELIVSLLDGRRLSVPLAWYPRLFQAESDERNNWRLLCEG